MILICKTQGCHKWFIAPSLDVASTLPPTLAHTHFPPMMHVFKRGGEIVAQFVLPLTTVWRAVDCFRWARRVQGSGDLPTLSEWYWITGLQSEPYQIIRCWRKSDVGVSTVQLFLRDPTQRRCTRPEVHRRAAVSVPRLSVQHCNGATSWDTFVHETPKWVEGQP